MKRIGSLTLAAMLGVAVWYGGPSLRAPQQALAQEIIPIPGSLGSYHLSYFDVATAFVPSAGTYGGPGNSGGTGDALLRIVDSGNWEADSTEGKVCANIYVFNDVQEEQECCSCPLTANSLQTSSVINNLTSNPLNQHESLSAGVIKIVGSNTGPGNIDCANTPGAVTAADVSTLADGLHAWINHTETLASNQSAIGYKFITDTSVEEFEHTALDSGELAFLEAGCSAINAADSHGSQTIGICSCGLGD